MRQVNMKVVLQYFAFLNKASQVQNCRLTAKIFALAYVYGNHRITNALNTYMAMKARLFLGSAPDTLIVTTKGNKE